MLKQIWGLWGGGETSHVTMRVKGKFALSALDKAWYFHVDPSEQQSCSMQKRKVAVVPALEGHPDQCGRRAVGSYSICQE